MANNREGKETKEKWGLEPFFKEKDRVKGVEAFSRSEKLDGEARHSLCPRGEEGSEAYGRGGDLGERAIPLRRATERGLQAI